MFGKFGAILPNIGKMPSGAADCRGWTGTACEITENRPFSPKNPVHPVNPVRKTISAPPASLREILFHDGGDAVATSAECEITEKRSVCGLFNAREAGSITFNVRHFASFAHFA